jgi:hypothetical protein
MFSDEDFIRWVKTQPRNMPLSAWNPKICPIARYVQSKGLKASWKSGSPFTAVTDAGTYDPSDRVVRAIMWGRTYGGMARQLGPSWQRLWQEIWH